MATDVFKHPIARRNFVKAGALISVGGAIGVGSYFFRSETAPSVLSAATSTTGKHFGVLLNDSGQVIKYLDVPERSHASAFNRLSGDLLFFSRRPGNEIYVFSHSGNRFRVITAADGRHFYGHGILDAEYRYLLTSENNYTDGRGRIVVRDVLANYAVVQDYSSYGVGPHELVFLTPETIAVANGGIRSHPSSPREDLDVDKMAPNVAFIHWKTGKVIGVFTPENLKLSLRHIARLSDQEVIVGAQSHDWLTPQQSLVFKIDSSGRGEALISDSMFAVNRKHYIASVCAVDEKTVVTTSPKSGHLDWWKDGEWSHSIPCFDVAGVCTLPTGDRLMFSNGRGDMVTADLHSSEETGLHRRRFEAIHWDNHLVAV